MDYAKDQQPCDQHPSTPVSALLDFKASSAVPNEMEIEIVKCTPSQDLEATVGNVSFASQSQDEDSIDGLHTDMRQLGVLSSPQGSVFEDSIGDFIWSQRRLNTREEPVLTIIDETEEENSSGNSLWFVKSSQDSEIDFEEQNEFLGRREGINHPRRVSPQANDTLDLTCTKNAISHDNNIAYEVIEGEEDTVLNSDENVQRTTSTVSTIDDRSSDSEREQLTTGGSPREVSVPAHIIQTSVEATPDFIIVFSNLFNWSTLKVSDKVEIHEPCRRIAMPEFGPTEYGAAAWIVERYKVVSS
ncbi:hypothetical protein BGZ54_005510 [Gamsiella multidivaricata]|nr:hypothetical protein BGZ54_005510 [Gamsiella multidivaricata]